MIDDGGERASGAKGSRFTNNSGPPGSTPAAFEWIMVAAGSGIVGNLAYDLLKGSAKRLAAASKSQRPVPEHRQLLLLARLAVQLRCVQLGIDEPELESLRLEQQLEQAEGIEFHLRNSEMSAKVVLPTGSGEIGSADVLVTLFAVAELRIRRRRRR